MRVAVVGATGNIGTALLHHLAQDDTVDEVVGIARRVPDGATWPKVRWRAVDVVDGDLRTAVRGCDAVVHLAFAIQPSHNLARTRAVNVDGSARVFDAVVREGVPRLVYASSVGAYAPGPKDRHVDESWPTSGIRTSFYSRHKSTVERLLDEVERLEPDLHVLRLRPSLTFRESVGASVGRLFLGRLVPRFLLRESLVPVVPDLPRLRVQVTHSTDMGKAFQLALTTPARGAVNVAGDPVVDAELLADVLGARRLRLPTALVRGAVQLTWRARLQPTPEGWLDMALQTPLMDTTRARRELGWVPQHDARGAIREVLAGLRRDGSEPTPALAPEIDLRDDPNVRLPSSRHRG
jgi:UDP-glucose 4-epimerase